MIMKTEMVHEKLMFERIYIYASMHARRGFYLSVGRWLVLMGAFLKGHTLGNYWPLLALT